MAEKIPVLCYTTVTGGYTAGSGVLNVGSTSTGSGILTFPTAATFTVTISDPATKAPKACLKVTGINSPTQFAVTASVQPDAQSVDVNCSAGDIVTADIDGRALLELFAQNTYSKFVATGETTTSTSFVDLSTLDSVTFTLPAAATVVISYVAYEFNSGANTNSNVVNVDGSDVASSYDLTFFAGSNPGSGIAAWRAALAAGSHTIKVRHKVSAGTGSWFNRQLIVQITS